MKAEYDFSKRKRGAILASKGKTRITIYIDDAVLEEFRARAEEAGAGYQTLINQALREFLSQSSERFAAESILQRVRIAAELGQSEEVLAQIERGELHPAMAAFGLWQEEEDPKA